MCTATAVDEGRAGALDHFIKRLVALCAIEPYHLVDEVCVGTLMPQFPGIALEVLVPDRLFSRKMDRDVVLKLLDDLVHLGRFRLKSQVTYQDVEQFDEFSVLFVNHRDAGGKVLVPGKYFEGGRHIRLFHSIEKVHPRTESYGDINPGTPLAWLHDVESKPGSFASLAFANFSVASM